MDQKPPPKIVVLDGFTMNPGDLDWDELNSLGQLMVYERTDSAQVIERIRDAEIVLTNKVILDKEVFDSCKQIKYVGVLATGYNVVDIEAATKRGVVVTNVPGYSTQSVAQLVFAHILNFTHHVADHAQSVRDGDWASCKDFCFWLGSLTELDKMTIGLVGFGKIGQAVARIATAFGMNVLVYKPNIPKAASYGIQFVSKEELFQKCDIVSLHCPLNDDTEHLINSDTLKLMKRSAILINTGRGGLIDESDLYDALKDNRIAGAGLDVASTEPIAEEHPLTTLENCQFTPHIGWATIEARKRLMCIVVKNIESFIADNPQNVVSQ